MIAYSPLRHSERGQEDRSGSAPPAVLEAGALAYRYTKDGELLILLVSKKRSKQCGIPKGKLKPHLSFADNATREAFEEAGIKGRMSPNSVAVFRDQKRNVTRVERNQRQSFVAWTPL
jgi:ADP-ribose pyrophosphatase YjhB (NUDIX family)